MSILPQRLTLTELGNWEAPASISTIHVDHDAASWRSHGWQASTYDGTPWYGGNGRSRQEIVDWLVRRGYTDTGDGFHYQLSENAVLDADIEPGIRKGIYDILSTWTKEANSYTALGLLEIAAYVEQHKEQLEEEAAARRQEIKNEQ